MADVKCEVAPYMFAGKLKTKERRYCQRRAQSAWGYVDVWIFLSGANTGPKQDITHSVPTLQSPEDAPTSRMVNICRRRCLWQLWQVAGGGTAGLVVANRLSENPEISVLVIEAGVSNEKVLNIEVPFYCTRASPRTLYDWNYTTVPQAALNSRIIDYPRGHVLGGSSSTSKLHDLYKRLLRGL
ncbi:hypothetical protein PM082_000182 [Marasmius tenuissimus]|nr:hypothetical protein PM082_000182 [Marasmius tenuissimus]